MISCPLCYSVPLNAWDDESDVGTCDCGAFRIHQLLPGWSSCKGNSNWTFRITADMTEWGLFLDGSDLGLRHFVSGDTHYPVVPKRRRKAVVESFLLEALAAQVLES